MSPFHYVKETLPIDRQLSSDQDKKDGTLDKGLSCQRDLHLAKWSRDKPSIELAELQANIGDMNESHRDSEAEAATNPHNATKPMTDLGSKN